MYEAYSNEKKQIVNVSTEYNLNEIFTCPYSGCTAQLKIESPTGDRAKHFSRYPGAREHIIGCPYRTFKNLSKTEYRLDYFNLDNVYNIGDKDISKTKSLSKNKKAIKKDNKIDVGTISTPKKLLKFCLSNSIDTVFPNKETVNDICVDVRNINKYAKGFTAKKLIVATTWRYKFGDEPYLDLKLEKKFSSGKRLFLNIRIYLEESLLKEINKYIFNTYGEKYEGYSIGILGDWIKDKDYCISCNLKSPKHIIFK